MTPEETSADLKSRLEHLLQERRSIIESLDVAVNVSNFARCINGMGSVEAILKEAALRVRSIIAVRSICFYVIAEDQEMSFRPVHCDPAGTLDFYETEKIPLIQDRTVAWALRREKPVIVSSSDRTARIMLHALSTPTSILGLCMAELDDSKALEETAPYPDFLSIVLATTAEVLESFLLTRKITALNAHLEEKIASLERSESELLGLRDRLEEQVRARTRELEATNAELTHEVAERKRMELELRYMATHDALTGLPSRSFFHDSLEQAIAAARRTNSRTAVMFLDLDSFKQVNDTLGHDIGDLLLVEIAHRLRESVRETDTVARMGGDEFMFVLPGLSAPGEAAAIARKVIESINREMSVGGHTLRVTGSIGISIFPDDGDSVQTLMRRADTAMFRSKERGRNRFSFFEARREDALTAPETPPRSERD